MSALRQEGDYIGRASGVSAGTFLAVLMLGLFAILSVTVNAGALYALDRWLLAAAQKPTGNALDALMFAVSLLGSIEVTGVVILAIVVWPLLRRRPLGPADLVPLVIVTVGTVIEVASKTLIHQPSPPGSLARGPRLGITLATAYSFPSGHMLRATMAYGLAAVRVLPRGRRPYWPWLYLALIFLIGYSRVYLGQHWPTDVVGGVLLGGAGLAGSLAALPRIATAGDSRR